MGSSLSQAGAFTPLCTALLERQKNVDYTILSMLGVFGLVDCFSASAQAWSEAINMENTIITTNMTTMTTMPIISDFINIPPAAVRGALMNAVLPQM